MPTYFLRSSLCLARTASFDAWLMPDDFVLCAHEEEGPCVNIEIHLEEISNFRLTALDCDSYLELTHGVVSTKGTVVLIFSRGSASISTTSTTSSHIRSTTCSSHIRLVGQVQSKCWQKVLKKFKPSVVTHRFPKPGVHGFARSWLCCHPACEDQKEQRARKNLHRRPKRVKIFWASMRPIRDFILESRSVKFIRVIYEARIGDVETIATSFHTSCSGFIADMFDFNSSVALHELHIYNSPWQTFKHIYINRYQTRPQTSEKYIFKITILLLKSFQAGKSFFWRRIT